MNRRATAIGAFCAVVVLAIGIAAGSRAVRRQDETLAGLQKEKTELTGLRAENETLRTVRVDTAELARLREENDQLPGLRNRVRQLREARQLQNSREPEAVRQLREENERLQQHNRELRELQGRAGCIRNLGLIDAAKKQWAENKRLPTGERMMMDDLAASFPNGTPACPGGGYYTANRVGSPPLCSIGGHSIP